jgi:hypothetical protein
MSGTTSVPPVAFTDNGFVPPPEMNVVTGLDADFNAAFGGDLDTDASTPQGQLITSMAAILGQQNAMLCALFNGVDPARATGVLQDAIARIYYLYRDAAEPTVLQVSCSGLVGVVIPVGALVSDVNDQTVLFQCTGAGLIPPSGSITLQFASQEPGPVPVPSGIRIAQQIPNWNSAALISGIVGSFQEGRAAFEARRQATVAANGAGFLPAISGAVGKVAGVIDWYATENPTAAPVTIGGVSIAANSLYVCVAGGLDLAVATAIWTKKNPGCAYTGGTSVTVTDTNSGYSPPLPTYVVKFQRPTAEAICFAMTIVNSSAVPANALALIAAAINTAFLGQDNGPRARIGSEIFASRFYAGVAALGSWALIVSILVGTQASPTASTTGSIAGTALTVSSGTGIAIGQFVYGVGVASGTIITAGAGTSWTVAVSQTVGSEAMVFVAANQNDVTMQINQIPTFAPGNPVTGVMPDINLTLV